MANFTNNITAIGASTAQQPATGDKQLRWTFTGTYTGVTGFPQGSNDGTNYVNLTGVREDTGAAFNGSISNGNFSILVNIGGWKYVRFNVTAISSGTFTVRGDTGTSFSLPLGVTPVSLASIGTTLTSASANAFAVGANGTTNPVLQVDASAGSAATGWKLTGNAAASGAALAVISSGTNENGTIDAKGSGTLTLQGTATGAITLGQATSVSGAVTVTSTGASALAVGANGGTNPVLQADASTASVATGLKVKGAAAAGGLAISVISSGTNEALSIDAKGSGAITIGGTSTGAVKLGAGAAAVQIPGTLTAGGLLTCALQVATSGPLIYSGSGAPTISAAVKGSIYLRTDGSTTSTRMYVATDTAGTWTAVTTAA